jgi:hypothetical protein
MLDPLLPRPLPDPRRRRRLVIVVAVVGACLVLLVTLLLAFLYPRTPTVSVVGAGLPPGVAPPTVVVSPPTMFIPITLRVSVENSNFYEITLLGTSTLSGYYSSVVFGRVLWAAHLSLPLHSLPEVSSPSLFKWTSPISSLQVP